MENRKLKIMKKIIYLVCCISLLVCTGCKMKRSYWENENQAEQVHVNIVRFDNDLVRVQQATIDQDIQELYAKYPQFMPMWVEIFAPAADLLGVRIYDTTYIREAIPAYLNDTVIGFKQMNALEQRTFTYIDDIQLALDKAFTRVHTLLPDKKIPTVYLFTSGLVQQLVVDTTENIVAVGADMYLGSDYKLYDLVVYNYQKTTMRKECIPVDILYNYLSWNIPDKSKKNRLLDRMIYSGKIMYLLAQVFDEVPEYEVMGWTRYQWNWSVSNEQEIWNLVMDKRDLFKTESLVISNYMNDAPFTSEVSQDSPGRLGIWLGWRIVESYMEHNREVTLQQLLDENDAQKILEESHYCQNTDNKKEDNSDWEWIAIVITIITIVGVIAGFIVVVRCLYSVIKIILKKIRKDE